MYANLPLVGRSCEMRTSSVSLRELGRNSLRRFSNWVEFGGKSMHRRMTGQAQVVTCVEFETGAKRRAQIR